MGKVVLLGPSPMQHMDPVFTSRQRRVEVNPLDPNFAAT